MFRRVDKPSVAGKAKSNQVKANGANESVGKTAQNSAASAASDVTKKVTDEKQR